MSNDTAGRYQLLGEIGRGGMATVYRALDPNSNREVAIKILPREMMHNPEFRARFKREITMISSLEHPAIVPVYDSGEQDGQLFFVMRYMAGGSLAELLKDGRLSPKRTAEIIEKVSLGLDYAHQKGVTHRDIKPDNILFDANGNPYISDFGVAKLAELASSGTGSGIMGTPAYISPEQAGGENEKVDHRSDVYGLGVLVYQMLTGKQPYTADTSLGVLVKHINEPVPNILDANPGLPPWYETVIKTAMAKRKEDRYHSVLEFARAVSVSAFGTERTVPSALILERKRLAVSKRRRIAFIFAGSILLLLIAGAYFSGSRVVPSPLPTPTRTTVIIPSATQTIVTPQPSPTPTVELTPTPVALTSVPTPDGGADLIALFDSNLILTMYLDASNPIVVDSRNIDKSNLQWTADGWLVYVSPSRNCAYLVDIDAQDSHDILCFEPGQRLEGFRVSPDGTYVAISVARTLYVVPFDIIQFKDIDTRFLLAGMENSCSYSLPVKDVRWSMDGKRIAALVVDTQQAGSDQIHLFELDLQNCESRILVATDKFPANHFTFDSTTIPSFDWDGGHLFLLNDFIRNDGFGDLYLYDSSNNSGKKINPINGSCCYRDARWSPDGKYVLFLYQNQFESRVYLYYIPYGELENAASWSPVNIPPDLFSPRDKPQPALRPAQ
ncbi:MAG TPA: protein kinase [Anaerolineales bacterium]